MSVGCHHGRSISEDDRTRRSSRVRRLQAREGTQASYLVDTLGLPIANRVEPANISDRYAAELLLAGLSRLYPGIQTVMANAGHESRKLASNLLRDNGWKLQIVKRRQRAFEVIGLTWIVERTFAWLGRNGDSAKTTSMRYRVRRR